MAKGGGSGSARVGKSRGDKRQRAPGEGVICDAERRWADGDVDSEGMGKPRKSSWPRAAAALEQADPYEDKHQWAPRAGGISGANWCR